MFKFFKRRWAVGFAAFLVLIIFFAAYPLFWQDKVFPGISVGGVSVGGLTKDEVERKLSRQAEVVYRQGLLFKLGQEGAVLLPVATALSDPDQTKEVFSYKIKEMVQAAYQVGRDQDWWHNLLIQHGSWLTSLDLPANFRLDIDELADFLRQNFSHLERAPQNADLTVAESGQLTVSRAASGLLIDRLKVGRILADRLANFSLEPIELELVETPPVLNQVEVQKFLPQAQLLLATSTPFLLTGEWFDEYGVKKEKVWRVDNKTLSRWLGVEIGSLGKPQLTLRGEEFEKFLDEIAAEVFVAARDAKFEMTNGRVVEFQSSHNGQKLDRLTTIKSLKENWLTITKITPAEIGLEFIKAKVTTSDVNSLGIKEIIGIGKSNFAGSPPNRRHNIKVSSEKLHGLLIAPGEEFSLVAALKPFTAEAGYLPELVIKGNRLVPEIGGGACQIGTTTFRAALNSGLTITQRRNHSFAVSYYNDENGLPGTDATIYDPLPDLRFINDTGNHILIQTRIEGDELIYEFWGTADGRQATHTAPVILSKIPPPPTKYIKTVDLKAGEKRCSGSNVPGYVTTFTYRVTLPSGEVREEKFDSRYRPWQQVCLVGAAADDDSAAEF